MTSTNAKLFGIPAWMARRLTKCACGRIKLAPALRCKECAMRLRKRNRLDGRFVSCLAVIALLMVSSAVAHADTPWRTYECVGEPASTGQATNDLAEEWQYSGQVGNDIVVCKLVDVENAP